MTAVSMPAASKLELISNQSRAEIDRWVAKYPPEHKRSAVMAALEIVQQQNGGWLTTDLMDAVAEYLAMPPIAVYEVATFYSMYQLQPCGRHKVSVCTNISCMLCGSDAIAEHIQSKLGIKFGQSTADGKFFLQEVECLGACVGAPMMQVNKDYYEHLTPQKVDEILEKLE